jgi:hypothetical protein
LSRRLSANTLQAPTKKNRHGEQAERQWRYVVNVFHDHHRADVVLDSILRKAQGEQRGRPGAAEEDHVTILRQARISHGQADQQGRLPAILETGNGEHGNQKNGQLTEPGLRGKDEVLAFVDGQQLAQTFLSEAGTKPSWP